MMKMMLSKPALRWVEGLPVGNGTLGAMVCSSYDGDDLYLNEDTLWSGYPGDDENPLTVDDIERSRQLAQQGLYRESTEAIAEKTLKQQDGQMYEPFGCLHLRYVPESGNKSLERVLDLDAAVITSTVAHGDVLRSTETFCSAPDSVLVHRVVSSMPFTCEIAVNGGFLHECEWGIEPLLHRDDEEESAVHSSGFVMMGRCPGRNRGVLKGGISDDSPWESPTEGGGMAYAGYVSVWCSGGDVKVLPGGGLLCSDTTEMMLAVTSATGFRGTDVMPQNDYRIVASDLKSAREDECFSYAQVRSTHIRDYSRFFDRVRLSLAGPLVDQQDVAIDVEALLEDTDELSLRRLTTLLFDYGRYLLISSSRPGSQPATLQGIWNASKVPPWLSGYTTNVNIQMNYWLTGPCNLPEMIEPLVDMNRELLPHGRATAMRSFGSHGSAVFHNVDLWRKSTPAHGDPSWSFWPFGQAWMCRNLYDEYLFTGDLSYLKRIWPVMAASGQFVLDSLRETPQGLAVAPATSPENLFYDGDTPASVALYSENTLAIARNLLRDLIAGAEALKSTLGHADVQLVAGARRMLPLIVATRIGPDGRVLEWNEPFAEVDRQHRHLSHLYELHPGTGITRSAPQLFAAARDSLLARGDDGSGWSLVWRMMMWARLGDGERVRRAMRLFTRVVGPDVGASVHGGGVYANLLCAHPPFQIDGNLGFTAAVAEMLVQSHDGVLRILPALPRGWDVGGVRGLVSRGGIRLDIDWNAAEIRCRFRVERPCDVEVSFEGGNPTRERIWDGCTMVTTRGGEAQATRQSCAD